MKEFKLNNNRIFKIVQDDSAESPRKWDNLGTIYHWHSRSVLGDIDLSGNDHIKASDYVNEGDVMLPIYCYEHGCIQLSTEPFSCPWDSGQVGFIVISKEKMISEYSQDYDVEKIKGYLRNEIETFNQFLGGDVYGYQLIQENKCDHCNNVEQEEIDSCYGFFGLDLENNGILENLDNDDREEILKQTA